MGAPLSIAGGPIRATVEVPGSKSIANRALICAALAPGRSTVHHVATGDDTRAMLDGLGRLGVTVEQRGTTVVIDGGSLRGGATIDARLAGTTSRFLTALAALDVEPTVVDGEAALRRRPMSELHDALRSLGADVRSVDGCLPVTVSRAHLSGGRVEMRGDVSSQFVSALMMIAPCLSNGLRIDLTTPLVSRPYVAITASVMSSFGAEGITVGEQTIGVEPSNYAPCEYRVESDASSASYPLAAAAITRGEVRVEGVGANALQGDARFADLLEAMGCEVVRDRHATTVSRRGALRGIDVDMSDVSDLVPTIAVVAAFAASPTRITGVGFIRRKESDRIGDVVAGLKSIGCGAEETDDGLTIVPGDPSSYRGTIMRVHDDHRLAMSWSLLALVVPGISVDEPEVVSKSWPDWWQVRSDLLGSVNR
ncbi:MAG: 3-phosphoshikimate 1-carboxyvinyltransferase [Actinomycetota bacterium]